MEHKTLIISILSNNLNQFIMSFKAPSTILETLSKIEKYAEELFDSIPTEAQNDWAVCSPYNALMQVVSGLKAEAEAEADREAEADAMYQMLFDCANPIF